MNVWRKSPIYGTDDIVHCEYKNCGKPDSKKEPAVLQKQG